MLLALSAPLRIASVAGEPAIASVSWQRDAAPLLWGFNNMYNPCVLEVGGDWSYRMWFFGWAARHANAGMGGGCEPTITMPPSGEKLVLAKATELCK
jgi:hypothetical protein